MSSSPRLAGVDALRGVAAIGIVVLHVWMFTGARDADRWGLIDTVIGELRLGLVFFFALSGYLLGAPWLRAALEGTALPRLSRYAIRRAARILPAYWVALAGAFVVLEGTGHPRAIDGGALPVFALFLQNQVAATAGELNPPTWSLGIEVAFYALLPLIGWALVRAGRRRGRAGIVAACAAIAALGLAWTLTGELLHWPSTVMTSVPTFLPVFACGLAAAALAYGRHPGRPTSTGLLVAGGALVVANGIWHSDGTGLAGHVLRDLPAGLGFGAILVGLTAQARPVLETWPLRTLGAISYGTYLWHMPVMYWLLTRGAFPEDPLLACLAVLAPTLVLGALSWLVVERPVLRWTRRRLARPQARRRPAPAPARRTGRREPLADPAS